MCYEVKILKLLVENEIIELYQPNPQLINIPIWSMKFQMLITSICLNLFLNTYLTIQDRI